MIDNNGGLMPLLAVFPAIKVCASQSSLSRGDRRLGQAGAGGARSRAMSDRNCPNICRDTATLADWNVTYLPWLTTIALIYTRFSRSVVGDQRSTPLAMPVSA